MQSTYALFRLPRRLAAPREMANVARKAPGEMAGALCPEFVPRRSPYSFTRYDKSGVASSRALYPFAPLSTASRAPRAFPYPTRRFRSLACTQNYRDRT